MPNNIEAIYALGQSVWYDNISRAMIDSGGLQHLINQGVTGLTANPTIFEKAISNSSDYDNQLMALAVENKNANEIYEEIVIQDIRSAADLLLPVYNKTLGIDGYVSLEVSPRLAFDTDGTIKEARKFFNTLNRPNILIKVPATLQGIPAIQQLISEGINVNVTLIFSLDIYKQVQEAYISGLEILSNSSDDLSRVASVASFFVSRVDTAVDEALTEKISQGDSSLISLMGKAAVANAKIAYRSFQQNFYSERFNELISKGAMVQRPLWASTGTKNTGYSDVLYVDSLIGKSTVNTMPDLTLEAFLDHGIPLTTVTSDLGAAEQCIQEITKSGVLLESITDKLLSDGVTAFSNSFESLISHIETKRANLIASHNKSGVANTGA
jgi:transaldolase